MGKIGAQVERVKHREATDQDQPNGVKPAFGRIPHRMLPRKMLRMRNKAACRARDYRDSQTVM